MLPAQYRLKKRAWFLLSQQQPKLGANSRLALVGIPKSIAAEANLPVADDSPGFALIISKKVHKHAVQRNRIRRQLREVWRREILPVLQTQQHHSWREYGGVIGIVRQRAAESTFTDLRHSLLTLFHAATPTEVSVS